MVGRVGFVDIATSLPTLVVLSVDISVSNVVAENLDSLGGSCDTHRLLCSERKIGGGTRRLAEWVRADEKKNQPHHRQTLASKTKPGPSFQL
jgi:hypothetical protein